MTRVKRKSLNEVSAGRRAFTLIEILATLMLMAIAMPAVMEGVTISTGAATMARMRTQAAALGQSQLATIVASGSWSTGNLSGDFPNYPGYRWQATAQDWADDTSGSGLQEIDLQVIWTFRNREVTLPFSTLAYVRPQAASTGS